MCDIRQIIYKGQCPILNETFCKDSGFNDQKQWKGGRKWIAIFIHFGQYTNDYSGVGRKCNVFYRFQGVVATAVKCLDGTTFESVSRSCQPGNHSIGLGCQLHCNPSFDMYGFSNNFAECLWRHSSMWKLDKGQLWIASTGLLKVLLVSRIVNLKW